MKKGQLTIYIILGLILLISILFIMTIRYRQTIEDGLETTKQEIDNTPEQFKPIKVFVEECLQNILTEGIEKLGRQGGYIDVSTLNIQPSQPTESDGIDFFADNNLKIPYWWYLSSENDIETYQLTSNRPALYRSGGQDSIESQLDKYVESELKTCLQNFKDFKQFTITEEELPTVRISIRQKDVLAQLYYPLIVKNEVLVSEINRFDTIVEIGLPEIYQVASNIVNVEMNNSIFELYTMNLIAAFAGLNKNQLPPTDASEFDPSSFLIWSQTKVKSNIEEMLMAYVPLLQVYGSLNFKFHDFEGDELREALYAMRVIPSYGTSNISFLPYNVEFTYINLWPAYLNIEGRGVDGDIIGPERATVSFFPWLAINRFQNYYDISYPMVVEIFDPLAFNGRGFTFLYGIEVNVRDNYPLNISTDEPLTIEMDNIQTYLCKENMKRSGSYKFSVYNKLDGEPVSDIPIYYTCGDSCMLGLTNSLGELETTLPQCYGGRITTQDNKYFSTPIPLSVKIDSEVELEIPLYPILELNATISKKSMTKSGSDWMFNDAKRFLDWDAESIIYLKRIKADPLDRDMTSSFFYLGNESLPGTVNLVPGKYEVTIHNLLHKDITIPEGEYCVDTGIIFENEECSTIDEINFEDPFPFGGLELDNTDYNETGIALYWEVTEDIYDASYVNFFTIAVLDDFMVGTTVDLNHKDLVQMGKVGEYSALYRSQVEPELIILP